MSLFNNKRNYHDEKRNAEMREFVTWQVLAMLLVVVAVVVLYFLVR